jgi:hypothetical protein
MPPDLAPPDATHEKMLWAHPGVVTETLNRNAFVMG